MDIGVAQDWPQDFRGINCAGFYNILSCIVSMEKCRTSAN